jgi:hypothetical protein
MMGIDAREGAAESGGSEDDPMTEEERRTVVSEEPATPGSGSRLTSSRSIESRPSGGELARRIVVLIFGLIQILIALRIVLLLLDAREANALVKGILDLSQVFVAPFEGILRTDALKASGSILDITAIVAFVGWTILELIVIWVVRIFRREPA